MSLTQKDLQLLREVIKEEMVSPLKKLQKDFRSLRQEFEDIRREFSMLRQEFEDIRREFSILRQEFEDLRLETKNDTLQFKDDILTEIVKLREDVTIVTGYRQLIANHEERLETVEDTLGIIPA